MAGQKGWTVRKQPNGKWLGRALVPGQRKYQCKSFDREAQAKEWAKRTHAELVAGVQVAASGLGPRCDTVAIADAYVANLEALRRSVSHVRETKRVLAQLATAVPDLGQPQAALQVERWLNAATAQHSAATRNRWLVAVRGMCTWAQKRKLLDEDPTAAIDRAALPEYLKPQFSVEECRRLLCAVRWDPARGWIQDEWHLRFAVMLYAGLRIQEAAGVQWQDIDWSGRTLMVRLREERGQVRATRVKRNRERLVPLQAELAALLQPHRRREGLLFPSMEYNPNRGFAGYLARCGIPKQGRSPHSCRHTFGGLMTASGLVTPLLMAYMGHSNIQTTLGYLKEATRFAAVLRDEAWPAGELRLLTGMGLQLRGAYGRVRREGAKHSRLHREVVATMLLGSSAERR